MAVGTKAVQAVNFFANNGKSLVHVKNGSAGSINVTITSVRTCNQGFNHDLVVAVGAGADKLIGPFPIDRFNDDSGNAKVVCSAVASVTMAVLTY